MGIGWALISILWAATSAPPGHAAIVVAYESGVDAYAEALQGIGSALGPQTVRAVNLQAADADLSRALGARDVQIVVAVGSRALAEVQSRKVAVPTIATMVLHSGDTQAAGVIDLEIPLSHQLQAMRSLWPNRLRVGIILNPSRSRYPAEAFESRGRKEGFTVLVVECSGPGQLLKAVASLKGKVDFLLCFPDPDLYNAVTIKPLVMASLEDRLPIVGFSPAFVRAGAAAGIYPDYRETGRQTAEMAQRLLRGEDRGSEEGPRKIKLAVNQRVTRLLGVEFHPDGLAVEVFR